MSDIAKKLRERPWRRGGETDVEAKERRQKEREEGAAEIERLTARVAELEKALKYYATMYCEGPEGACGKLDASDCDGCRARAVITKGESND